MAFEVAFALFVLTCCGSTVVFGLTPQLLLAMDEAIYDELHYPGKSFTLDGIQNCTGKRYGRRNVSAQVMQMSKVPETEDFLETYSDCRSEKEARFCRVMILRGSPDSHSIDWTKKHEISTISYDCFPSVCTEYDIASSYFGQAGANNKLQKGMGEDFYFITHCDDVPALDVGFFAAIGFLALLVLFVLVGTLVDLYVNHNVAKGAKKRAHPSVPGWKTLFATPVSKEKQKCPTVPRIIISSSADNLRDSVSASARSDSVNAVGKWTSRRAGRRTTPISFPSLLTGTPNDRILIFRHGRNLTVQQSPSCSVIHKSGSACNQISGSGCSFTFGSEAWSRSQSFSNLADAAMPSLSSKETLNISDPSVFVSSLGIGEKTEDGRQESSEKISKTSELYRKRYMFTVTPRRPRIKSFLEALTASSAVRGVNKLYRGGMQQGRPASREVDKSPLTVVRCMQTIAVWCFLLYQTALFLGTSKLLDNPKALANYIPKLGFQIASNAFVHVNTMFFTSAVISTYAVMHKLGTSKRKDDGLYTLVIMFATKYIRQLPFYLLVVLIWSFVIPVLGSGPAWQGVRDHNCKVYWWTNLLYITNFCPSKSFSQCMPWLWFPCCEMQMYIFALPLTLLLHKSFKLGTMVAAGSMVSLSLVTVFLSYESKLDVSPSLEYYFAFRNQTIEGSPAYGAWRNDVFDDLLNKPYYNWGTYVVGVVFGSVLHRRHSLQNDVAAVVIGILHILSPFCLAALCLSTHWLYKENREASWNWRPVLVNFLPKLWVVCLVPVILHCRDAKHKGPISRLVSASWWIVIGRLNTAVYAVHPIVLFCTVFSADYTLHFCLTTLVVYFASSLLLAYLASTVLMLYGHYPLYYILTFLHTCLWKGGDGTEQTSPTTKEQPGDRQKLVEKNSNEPKCSKVPSVEALGAGAALDAPRHQAHDRKQSDRGGHRCSSLSGLISPLLRTQFYSPI